MVTAFLAMALFAPPAWEIGPFTRPPEFNPLIGPSDAVFPCPILGKPVEWERLHTFNPAAAVLDGKVYVLYRAE
ncbi:MAG TPA: hypothetical protein VMI31_00600, partial [Fimbriimonadaceae bacterium]|nr:hypothetical protein [Fimbriimonadaceae bacterium]